MKLEGLHHITMITGDAPRNAEFYADVLGLRLVKKTVNFDQPEAYHLYFGDERGTPGSISNWSPPGHRAPRVGSITRRCAQRDRDYFRSIYFQEPGGVLFEIATLSPGFAIDEDPDHLGEELRLPTMHEHLRDHLEQTLTPVINPRSPKSQVSA